MKNVKYIGLIVLVFFCFSSCSENWLELSNPNSISKGTFWKTEEHAVQGVNATYAALQLGGLFHDNGMTNAINVMADDGIDDSPASRYYRQDNFELYTNDQCVNIIWQCIYIVAYRSNQCLEHIPDIDMDPEKKERLLAEVRFLRALAYFYGVNIYHNIPLITKVAESKDDYYKDQANPDSVWSFLIREFKYAKNHLPPSYPSSKTGRVTKWAAKGFLGKSYLYTASEDTIAHENKSWDQEKLELARKEFLDIIEKGGFSLVNNYKDNFTIFNENNAESLFEVQFDAELGGTDVPWTRGEWATKSEASTRAIFWAPDEFGWADCSVSRGLFEAFKSEKTANGKDDPRLDATIVYNHPGEMVYGESYDDVYGAESDKIYPEKYTNNGILPNEMQQKSSINERILRYADILLMQAEVLNEMNRTSEAVPYINQVRQRANLEKIPSGISQAGLRERICKERYRELALEQWRLFDIRRWGWLYDTDKRQYLISHDPAIENWRRGREYLPIPRNELETNPKLEQNPGYSAN